MREPKSAGDLLSERPHTQLPGDEDAQADISPREAQSVEAQDFIDDNPGVRAADAAYDASSEDDAGVDDDTSDDQSASAAQEDSRSERENPIDKLREQLNNLVDDAEEDELKLTDYQRYWRRLKDHVLHHVNTIWRLDGPTLDAAAHIGTAVRAGQVSSSYLSQLYAATHFGAQFKPFEPDDDIMERPGVSKLQLYSRPIRERSIKAQLNRLETLVNTDLQLSKTRTLYSAFAQDQETNRTPIKTYRRVTTGEKPCALCEIAADQVYFTDDLMAIHDNCMCDIEVSDGADIDEDKARYHHIGFVQTLLDTGDQKQDIQTLADEDAPIEDYHNLVKIEQHGELGPVIVWAGQKFTGPADLPNPMAPRPVPSISGPGLTHEARLARNKARVAQYRRQHFADKPEPQYHPEHGVGSSHVRTPPYGLPPTTKTVGPKPTPKPKEEKPDIPRVSMGKVTAVIGRDGSITIKGGMAAAHRGIDWNTSGIDDILDYMATKHADAVPRASWRMSLWTSPKYNPAAKRKTLQAIDEMLTKYPDVKVGSFKIETLDEGVVAETRYSRALGDTNSMVFNASLLELKPADMVDRFKQSEDNGLYFTDAHQDPYRAMVYHEYGHVLDIRGHNQARTEATATMTKLYADDVVRGRAQSGKDGLARWMGEKDRLSGYSMAEYAVPGKISPITGKPARLALAPGEAIAQAFDDVERRGDAASDVSKALHDLVVEKATAEVPVTPSPYTTAAALKELSAVDRLAKATAPKFKWTDAQMAEEDNIHLSAENRALAKELATEIYMRGARVEPAITAVAKSSVEHNGGFMSGLDFRLKTGPSLYRKIQAEAIGMAKDDPKAVTPEHLRRASKAIKDSVRYTGIMPQEGYWSSGDNIRKAMESLGAKTIKDPIGIPLKGYRGRNFAFEYHGVPFEMQVNTEQGVAIKDENHQIYNVSRKLEQDLKDRKLDPDKDPEYQKMLQDMQTNWDAIPIMEGTPVVATEKIAKSGDVSKILYVAKDSKYRGPTVPNGEADIGSPEMRKRERVPSSAFGMDWVPDSPNAKIVSDARELPADKWDQLPVQTLPHGTPIKANEGTLKKSSLDKVISGAEPFREGYVTKLWREPNGDLHVVDGHHRVAMYHALGKDMPVRILDRPTLEQLSPPDEVSDKLVAAKPKHTVTRYGPGGPFEAPYPLDPKDVADKGISFLDHEHMVANILARYNDTVGDKAWIRAAGQQWYPSARAWILKMLDDTGSDMDLDKAAAIVAQYSENASWTDNMARAMNYFNGKPTKAFKATDARTKAIADSDDPLSMTKGPKVNNFVRAILGADRFPDAVAVDRWAARISLGSDDKELASKILGRSGGYEAMANAYRDAARQLGIAPSELQAVTWVHAVPPDKTVAAFKEAGEWQF